MVDNSTHVIPPAVMDELERIAREQGHAWALEIQNQINNGKLDLSGVNKFILHAPLSTLNIENLPILTRATMWFGTQEAGEIGNTAVVGFGVYSAGASAIGFSATTDKKARTLYTLSVLCSMSAITSSGAALVAKSCNISGVGIASETAAMAFLKLGNRARAIAYQLEGRPLPKGLEKYYDPGLRARMNSGDLGFIMPGHFPSEILDTIPFELIGKIIGGSLAIYGYSRLVIKCYRYGQKLITKYRSIRKKKLILKQARFLVSALIPRPTVYKDFISRNSHSIITV